MRHILVYSFILATSCVGRVNAQFIYLDTNGDGTSTIEDRLGPAGTTTAADVWIVTNADRAGRTLAAPCERTINSYEFILRSEGGAVHWGEYHNLQASMPISLGSSSSATEFYVGYFGNESLPPGRYKLGTLKIETRSGSPRVDFTSKTSLWAVANTSFGSHCPGIDMDYTLKFRRLGEIPSAQGVGDWSDASGLYSDPNAQTTATQFSVSVSPNPANPDAVIQIETTRTGPMRVHLFNQSGRLVRTLADEDVVGPGVHFVHVSSSRYQHALASGLYLYQVNTADGSKSGKLIILK